MTTKETEDAALLAEANERLRAENGKLKAQVATIPLLERQNRRDRFCLALMAIVSFVGMGIGRLYWQAEGREMVCPIVAKAAPPLKPEACRDSYMLVSENTMACPHPDHAGTYVHRDVGTDLFVCTCLRKNEITEPAPRGD